MTARQGNLLSAGATLLFTLTMLALAVFRWEYSAKVMTFPAMAGTLVILCAGWLVVRSYIAPEAELDKESEPFSEGNRQCSLTKRMFWLSSIFPLGYVFGFLAGLIAFSIAYTSYHCLPWWQRLLTAALIFAFVYLGFFELLGVPLPIEPVWLRD